MNGLPCLEIKFAVSSETSLDCYIVGIVQVRSELARSLLDSEEWSARLGACTAYHTTTVSQTTLSRRHGPAIE
jgi:hypothetical protein